MTYGAAWLVCWLAVWRTCSQAGGSTAYVVSVRPLSAYNEYAYCNRASVLTDKVSDKFGL